MRYCVILTGCAGFVGSVLHRHLASCGHFVIGIDRLPCKPNGTASDFVSIQGDVADDSTWDMVEVALHDSGADRLPRLLYHAAGYASEIRSDFEQEQCYHDNVEGTEGVLRFITKHPDTHLVYFSTAAVYGECEKPRPEKGPFAPLHVYGDNKLRAEITIRQELKRHASGYLILRAHNLYGEGQRSLNERNVIARWLEQAARGDPLTVYCFDGHGCAPVSRQFTYMPDLAQCLTPERLIPLIDLRYTINVGNHELINILDAAALLSYFWTQETGQRCTLDIQPTRKEARCVYVEHTLADQLGLGTEHFRPFRQGLLETVKWFVAKQAGTT